jgi:DNA-damage-inducible protein J
MASLLWSIQKLWMLQVGWHVDCVECRDYVIQDFWIFETLETGLMATIVQADIDEQTVKDAEAVLRPLGFTTPDVVRLLITRIARDKALPFEAFQPNETTIEAMRAARRGEVVTVGDIEGLFASLHADD